MTCPEVLSSTQCFVSYTYLLCSLCSIPGPNRCCFMYPAFRMVSVLVIKSYLFVVLVNLWASVSTVTELLLKVKIMNHVSWACVTLRSVSTASQRSFVNRYFPSLLRTVVRTTVINYQCPPIPHPYSDFFPRVSVLLT